MNMSGMRHKPSFGGGAMENDDEYQAQKAADILATTVRNAKGTRDRYGAKTQNCCPKCGRMYCEGYWGEGVCTADMKFSNRGGIGIGSFMESCTGSQRRPRRRVHARVRRRGRPRLCRGTQAEEGREMRVWLVNCLYASSSLVTVVSITATTAGEAFNIAVMNGYTPLSVR